MAHTILVADDDLDNRSIIAAALSAAGYRVCLAADGRQALLAAARENPSLVLMDMSLPVLDGWEAARRIKSDPRTSHIPVFAFTAHALAGNERKARDAGCEDFIAKPCVPREVVKRIAARLGRVSC